MSFKKTLSIILLIIILLLLPNIVNAETDDGTKTESDLTWADTSNLAVLLKNVDGTTHYDLEITGITELDSHYYYIFITNDTTEPTLVFDNMNFVSNYDYMGFSDLPVTDYLERKGDIYLWICEQQRNPDTKNYEQKFIVSAKQIERPEQRQLGSRLYIGLDSEKSTISIYEPHTGENKRKVMLKIGQVTDNSILSSIKNGETDSLSKLLTYAKTANSIYTGTIPVEHNGESIINSINLINDAYYYIYAILDDEDVYYPVEEIAIVQAYVSDYNSDYKILSTGINWDLGPIDTPNTDKPDNNNTIDNTIDNTTANVNRLPQTGENVIIIAILIVFVVVSIVLFIKNKQYRDIR